MKKMTLRSILFTALLSVMLIGCGGNKDYRNMLPDDSFMIMSMNIKSLREKADAGDPTQNLFHKLIQRTLETNTELSDADRVYLLSVISDLPQAGIDDASDCFTFIKMKERTKPEAGILFRIKDLKKFETLIDFAVQKGAPEKRHEKGFTVIADKSPVMIAYNNVGVMVFIADGGYERNISRVTELFNQNKDRSLLANKEILKMMDAHNDMCMMMSFANVPDEMMKQLQSNPMFDLIKKLTYIMPVNFEKGKIVAESKVYFADNKTEKEFFELNNYANKQSGKLVKFIPQNSIITIGMNSKGDKIYEQLTAMSVYGQMMGSILPQFKTVIEAIEGDIIISFNKMDTAGKMPEATLVAELSDPAAIRNMLNMLTAMPVKQTAPYQYETSIKGMNVSFGLQDNLLYVTTDPMAASAIKGANINSIEPRFGKLFKGSYGTVAIDFISLHMMLETMLASGTISQGVSYALPMIKIFDSWEMATTSRTEGSMVAYMTDKEKNSLSTIYHTIESMVAPFMEMAISSYDTVEQLTEDSSELTESQVIAE